MKKLILKFILMFMIILGLGKDVFAGENTQILFSRVVDGYWQIWTMDEKGEHQRALTSSPSDKRDPVAVKNGRAIAYRTNNGQLFVFDHKTGEEEEFLTQFNNISNPSYNDQSDEIIFTRFDPRSNDVSNIWKSDWDGKNAVILTKDNILKYQPALNWQGDHIAYVQANPKTLDHQIWLMGSDGSNGKQVTFGKGFFTLPSFSPNSKKITLTSNYQDDNYEIYTLDLANLKMTRVTNDLGLDSHSRYSPDGEKMVFVSDRSGSQQIWVMDNNGADPKQLTFGPEEAINPAWALMTE